MKKIYFSGLMLFCFFSGFSQYKQSFDTLVNTGTGLYTLLPEGWGIYEIGTGTHADGKYAVGIGSSDTGNAYSFGATGSTDRALGAIASGTNFPTMGVIFFNENDTVKNSITISYTGEQYRYGGRTTGTKDTLRFEYSLDATGIANNTGTWVRVKQLDFQSVNITGTEAAVLDGNIAMNRQVITYTITGLNLRPGASIVLRWSDVDIAGNDDGLAIDDFSISGGFVTGVMSSGGTTTGGGISSSGEMVSSVSTSVPVFQNIVAVDSGFITLYGNLHGHSTHSDGKPSTGEPFNDYEFARTALGMDFLGISEHNHTAAGLQIANYKKGSLQADTSNGKPNIAGKPFIALHGMEWGTISGGGHVVIYGFKDSLLGWETGNYDIYVPKSDYIALFDKVRNNPEAVATLAHPNTTDFSGLTGGYKGIADSAVASVAIESGPAFSTGTTYNDFPASLAYINYYRALLLKGYRLGANMDQDNHELTYGKANANRMAVLAKDRSREGILNALRSMRVYATNDYNATVNFTINNYVLGSSILTSTDLTGVVAYGDADGEGLSAIQVYGGKVGGADVTLIKSATANTSFLTTNGIGETWFYYVIITQPDGNKIITSPIWVTQTTASVPVKQIDLTASLYKTNQVKVKWNTSTEINSSYFMVERSGNLTVFDSIGKVKATSAVSSYSFIDTKPVKGYNYYRLKQVNKDGHAEYSNVVTFNMGQRFTLSLFPSPATNTVRISTGIPGSQKLRVQIIDIGGNLVYDKVYSSNQITIDVSQLPNGTYVVRAGDQISKLIIKR